MRYFKNPDTGAHHGYDVDGHQDHMIQYAIENNWEEMPEPVPVIPDPIVLQIFELERSITIRRLSEAILGMDNGWLKKVHAQISALRAKQVKPPAT